MDPVKLHSVRPFILDSACLADSGINPQEEDQVENYLADEVDKLIEKAKEGCMNDKLPLVRLKVCECGRKKILEKKVSPWRDLNSRPLVYKTSALTTELQRHAVQ